MKLTNIQMDNYINELNGIAEKTSGKLAYGIARNMRKLSDELVEYNTLKNKMIAKYGDKREDGSAFILIGSEGYDKFLSEMEEVMNISHDVDIFLIPEEDVINSDLNGKEMLAIDFMIQKGDNNV